MIKTTLIGHIGQNARVNEVGGKKVINFSVAHTEKWKDSQGVQNERTMWVECAMWRDNVAVAQYLVKGTLVYVEGIPSVNIYRNKQNIEVAKLTIKVGDVKLLGSKRDGDTPAASGSQQPVSTGSESFSDDVDDLPF
ncbi:single-stranded DNA-binding protein [Niabella sp. 22666]|uniref:single-stranded DNA-binding protein n=1 Tax=Niabella sp. 22666 TaxID=3453954 RepID=UPI003F83E518